MCHLRYNQFEEPVLLVSEPIVEDLQHFADLKIAYLAHVPFYPRACLRDFIVKLVVRELAVTVRVQDLHHGREYTVISILVTH